MTFQQESFDQFIADALPLLEMHRQEVSHYKDVPLNVDMDFYRAVEKCGRFRCYTLREDTTLIGYCAWFVHYNPHYKDSLIATEDVLYLDPRYRKGGLGKQLIAYCQERLKSEGVEIVYMHVKAFNKVGLLLKSLGYELMDEVYTRRL